MSCDVQFVDLHMQMFVAKIEDGQLSRIQEIAQKLEKMGVEVRQVLTISGVITGLSRSLPLTKLKIKGICSVEAEHAIRKQ